MEARMMLRLVLAACFCCHSMSRSHFPTFFKTVVNDTASAYQVTGKSARIGGPNALCLDVKGADYRDETPIILWDCKKSEEGNQMWTFQGDGTIGSNDHCLASFYDRPGSYIVIINCHYHEKYILTWKMEENGAIVNPDSGLVLTAVSAKQGSRLILETNVLSSYQTWRFGDLEWREVGHIQGKYKCLQASASGVSMEVCQARNRRQYWVYLSDGTIRSPLAPGLCLSYDTEKRVVLSNCWADPVKQRWFFAGGSGPIFENRSQFFCKFWSS